MLLLLGVAYGPGASSGLFASLVIQSFCPFVHLFSFVVLVHLSFSSICRPFSPIPSPGPAFLDDLFVPFYKTRLYIIKSKMFCHMSFNLVGCIYMHACMHVCVCVSVRWMIVGLGLDSYVQLSPPAL